MTSAQLPNSRKLGIPNTAWQRLAQHAAVTTATAQIRHSPVISHRQKLECLEHYTRSAVSCGRQERVQYLVCGKGRQGGREGMEGRSGVGAAEANGREKRLVHAPATKAL